MTAADALFHGHVTNVAREIHGDELATTALAATTVLTVLDTADYDEDGGTVRIDDGTNDGVGSIHDYLAITDDPPTLTLTTGLAATLAAGTRVDVWDTEAAAPVQEWVADVVDDANGDVIQATVEHSLVDLLTSSVRAGITESVVCELDDDDLWSVTRVLGRSPEIDGEFVMVPGPDGTVRLPATLQDIYDAADVTAEAANEAAALAQQAYDSASGKNTIWRSVDPPGVTPNVVGDTWFQFSIPGDPQDPDAAFKQNIVAQYIGLGGTSWRQVEIAGEVIAYLDAGKITANSAFLNALQVLTLFTLGNASTNGVIQSYDFANQPVGVLIDKNGLVAKGGTIAGAFVIGGIIQGALFQTGSTGRRIEITTDGGITMYGGSSEFTAGPGYIDPGADFIGSGFFAGVLRISPPLGSSHPSGTPRPTLYLVSQPDALGGAYVSVDKQFRPTQGISTGSSIAAGSVSAPSVVGSSSVHGGDIYTDGETHAGPGNVAAYLTTQGRLVKTSSTRRVKRNIKALPLAVATKVLEMDEVTYAMKDEPGDYELPGFIAEQAGEAGADLWITRDADGIPDSIRYAEITVAHNALIRDLVARVEALEASNKNLVTRLAKIPGGLTK